MYGFTLKERNKNTDLTVLLSLEAVSLVI